MNWYLCYLYPFKLKKKKSLPSQKLDWTLQNSCCSRKIMNSPSVLHMASEAIQRTQHWVQHLGQKHPKWRCNENNRLEHEPQLKVSGSLSTNFCGLSMEHWMMKVQFSYRHDLQKNLSKATLNISYKFWMVTQCKVGLGQKPRSFK